MKTALSVAALVVFVGAAGVAGAWAQPGGSLPPRNGPRASEPAWHALRNATVHVAPGKELRAATVVFKDGVISAVLEGKPGPDGKAGTDDDEPAGVPIGPRVWDCTGLHVYPGFIDAYVEVDAPAPDGKEAGRHWNSRVTPQRSALDGAGIAESAAEGLRKQGFTAAAISPRGGVFRGRAAVVALSAPEADPSKPKPRAYRADVYQSVAFETAGFGGGGGDANVGEWTSYPSSQMGAIALVRQTLSDADWQAAGRAGGTFSGPATAVDWLAPNGASGAGIPSRPGIYLFDADDELEQLRALKVAREFSRPAMVLGSGVEFRRLEAIAREKTAIVLPLSFPRAPEVSSLSAAESVELREMMTWEQAPTNPRRLAAAGVTFALTTARLRDVGDFSRNLARAIRHGLSPEQAMAAVTTTPAKLLGVETLMGTIEVGKSANLVVADGPLFVGEHPAKKTKAGPKAADEARGERPRRDDAKKGEADAPAKDQAKEPAKEEPKGDDEKKDDAKPDEATKSGAIRDVWIDGLRHEITAAPARDLGGTWAVKQDGAVQPELSLELEKDNAVTVKAGEKSVKAKAVSALPGRLSFVVDLHSIGVGPEGLTTVSGAVDGEQMMLNVSSPEGRASRWSVSRTSGPRKEAEKKEAKVDDGTGAFMMVTVDDRADAKPGEPSAFIRLGPDRSVSVTRGDQGAAAIEVKIDGNSVAYTLDMEKFGGKGSVKVRGERFGDLLIGSMVVPDGSTHSFKAVRVGEHDAKPAPNDIDQNLVDLGSIPEHSGAPFGPYAVTELPAQAFLLFKGATIWTAGDKGVITDGVMLISEGKIGFLGTIKEWAEFSARARLKGGLVEIDLRGRHITPGLIDCHSHTGISGGVNEGGQAVTAEVRIEDVTNPDAISWYRQLAGGVTAVNNLHGSANAIGGQNCVNKNRWGAAHPDDMHLTGVEGGAMSGIKFALGENPTGANSSGGPRAGQRYPQTRMGVEALIRDRFTAGREYLAATKAYAEQVSKVRMLKITKEEQDRRIAAIPMPRRDLELEAVAEILDGKRLVHCHSYRSDEILMLARVSKEFGFKLATYQHGLEAYKVADAVKDSSIGASIFSDWWAYKLEVQDAIPYAGPIMNEVGVVVSFNSDSDELARRLNTEAAKAVKYGGIDPHEALKFVTINPAKQLKIDHRTGSLESGKDADIAVWSGPPLSNMSKCEMTFVDGRRLFSLEKDKAAREVIAVERTRLIQKLLEESVGASRGGGDARGGPPAGGRGRRRPPQEIEAEIEREYLDRLNRGLPPGASEPGECGCGTIHALFE